MPNLRSLSQLRSLLPYAAKLLPIITGIAVAEPALHRPDFSSLNRHFGEMQSESRGLRSQVEGQSQRMDRIQDQLGRLASHIESSRREQQEIATALRSVARLLKGLLIAVLVLLIAVTSISVLILLRMPHA